MFLYLFSNVAMGNPISVLVYYLNVIVIPMLWYYSNDTDDDRDDDDEEVKELDVSK